MLQGGHCNCWRVAFCPSEVALLHTGYQPSTILLCRKGRRKAAAGSDSDYSEDEAISSASEDDASNDEAMSEGDQSEGGPLMVGIRPFGRRGCFSWAEKRPIFCI